MKEIEKTEDEASFFADCKLLHDKYVNKCMATRFYEVKEPNGSRSYDFRLKYTTDTSFHRAPRPVAKLSSADRLPCDGPCKKMVYRKQLTDFGDCEHSICDQCLLDYPTPQNFNGMPFCPNAECLLLRGCKPSSEPIQAQSSNSSISYPFELLVRVVYLNLSANKRIQRHQFSFELGDNTVVHEMNKIIGDRISNLKKCAIYCTSKEKFKREHLKPLSADASNVPLGQLSHGNELITVIVTSPGLTVF